MAINLEQTLLDAGWIQDHDGLWRHPERHPNTRFVASSALGQQYCEQFTAPIGSGMLDLARSLVATKRDRILAGLESLDCRCIENVECTRCIMIAHAKAAKGGSE